MFLRCGSPVTVAEPRPLCRPLLARFALVATRSSTLASSVHPPTWYVSIFAQHSIDISGFIRDSRDRLLNPLALLAFYREGRATLGCISATRPKLCLPWVKFWQMLRIASLLMCRSRHLIRALYSCSARVVPGFQSPYSHERNLHVPLIRTLSYVATSVSDYTSELSIPRHTTLHSQVPLSALASSKTRLA